MIGPRPTHRDPPPAHRRTGPDYRVTAAMLAYFIKKASGALSFFKLKCSSSVPQVSPAPRNAPSIESTLAAGAQQVFLVKEPVLAAIGAKVPINSPIGNMILNIVGGTTVGRHLAGRHRIGPVVRVGGNKFDQAIVEYVKKTHGLAHRRPHRELIKINIAALSENDRGSINIKGRD